jgi:hypothetical protein
LVVRRWQNFEKNSGEGGKFGELDEEMTIGLPMSLMRDSQWKFVGKRRKEVIQ